MTHAELLARINFWTKRADLLTYMPAFIELAEARINRDLRVREQETAFTGTISSSNTLALPTEFAALKSVQPSGVSGWSIEPATLEQVIARNRTTGTPSLVHVGEVFTFDGTGEVSGVYFKRVPALTATATTNWLSLKHPDVYLFGALSEAFAFIMDKTNAALWGGRFESALSQVMNADNRDRFAAVLTARKG